MLYTAIVIFGWVCVVSAFALALWRGGTAERAASGLNLVITGGVTLFHTVLPRDLLPIGFLAADFALALGFLLISLRHPSLWLGLALLFEAAQFSLHAYYFVADARPNIFYAITNNVVFFAVMFCILGGTLMAWRRHGSRPAI